MTSVNRVATVSHSTVSGGGEWDHRLNRLLEDLQGSVVPTDGGKTTEFREYRMHSSTKRNDEPAEVVDEKWVEYGSTKPGQSPGDSAYHSSKERTVNFADDHVSRTVDRNVNNVFSSTSANRMEYLTPANSSVVVKSGPSSPNDPYAPKVEKKEFYSKQSYTTLVQGGQEVPPPQPVFDTHETSFSSNRRVEESSSRSVLPPLPEPSTTSTSETRRIFNTESSRSTNITSDHHHHNAPPAIGPPLYTSTPIKSTTTSSYNREVFNDRSVTPPPPVQDGLKTPPLVRKILQQSNKSDFHSKQTSLASRPPPVPSYDEPETRSTKYYTSTTTTEHRENRQLSPVRTFPSPAPPRHDTQPPKRLDELMRSFGESYVETRRIHGDGGGPHDSHPYGPGTQPVEEMPVHKEHRTVRIDESHTRNVIDSSDIHQRRVVNPVYGQPQEIPINRDKGKASAEMKREYKAKEKYGKKHDESKGKGLCPCPVCVPMCCAAPCTIM